MAAPCTTPSVRCSSISCMISTLHMSLPLIARRKRSIQEGGDQHERSLGLVGRDRVPGCPHSCKHQPTRVSLNVPSNLQQSTTGLSQWQRAKNFKQIRTSSHACMFNLPHRSRLLSMGAMAPWRWGRGPWWCTSWRWTGIRSRSRRWKHLSVTHSGRPMHMPTCGSMWDLAC